MSEKRELICICCPRGCRLSIDKDLNVSGNFCPRGAIYAKEEVTSPKRVVTSSVAIKHASLPLCPVKSLAPIPKEKIFVAIEELSEVSLEAPVEVGDIVLKDLAGTGVPAVATRKMEREEE